MKNPLKIATSLMLCGVFMITMTLEARAYQFKDVSTGHWAYANINRVADKGLMIGDFEGNFKPDDFIDKFDSSILLARIVGYDVNGTSAELMEYERIYKKWISMIEVNSKTFTKWKHNADYYIAFLLEHGVLVESDLYQFVIVMDGQERLRALTREEMALLLVRAMGKENAIHEVSGKTFADDPEIQEAAKPYVYYLQATGIVAGDTANNYNPKAAIQRSAMARVIDLANERMSDDTGKPIGNSSNYQTITGEIAQVYNGMNALQIRTDMVEYHGSIKIMSANVSIKIDGIVSTFGQLKSGMTFTGVIDKNYDEIVSISVSTKDGLTGETGDPIGTKPDDKVTTIPEDLLSLEGTVEKVSTSKSVHYLSVEIRMLSARGDVIKQSFDMPLASSALITRGSKAVDFSSITVGEGIKISCQGATIYKVQLEEEYGECKGIITQKKIENNHTVLVIEETTTNTILDYRVTSETNISRNNRKYVTFTDLRVGDTVYITTHYGDIVSLEATGYTTSVDIVIESFYHSTTEAYIIGRDHQNKEKKYTITSLSTQDYTELRVGATVRLHLDSDEVTSYVVLESSGINSFTGTILRMSRNTMELQENNSSVLKTFTFDENTTVVDATTGGKTNINHLVRGMKVHVVTSSANTKYARIVTILEP